TVVATSDSTPHTTSAATALPFAAIRPLNAEAVGSAAPIDASQPGTVEISPVATATTPTRALTQRPMPPNTATSAWFTAANATPATTAVPANAHHSAASYDATNCTMNATSTPCPAPIAAAGAKARNARAADER